MSMGITHGNWDRLSGTSREFEILQFYPNEPRAMGSIFFHEVAHLVGVPHKPVNESIYVPNCLCTPTDSKKEDGCLKIPYAKIKKLIRNVKFQRLWSRLHCSAICKHNLQEQVYSERANIQRVSFLSRQISQRHRKYTFPRSFATNSFKQVLCAWKYTVPLLPP